MIQQHCCFQFILLLLHVVNAVGFSSSLSSLLSSSSSGNKNNPHVLVVGATGGMGRQALKGLIEAGYRPSNLRILSRDVNKLKDLQDLGYDTVQGNLEDIDSLKLALSGCTGCYIHATGGDTKKLDTQEVARAQNLARAISSLNMDPPPHVVYNSAAGEDQLCGARKKQKREVEQIFRDTKQVVPRNIIPFTALRANLFMDEFWKVYTRPGIILKGTFSFSIPSDTPIYLTSVTDMGRIAGLCLQSTETTAHRNINLAGDVLTPEQMAQVFAKVQGFPCQHKRNRVLALVARLFVRELWEEMSFLRNTKESTDIEGLKQEFGYVTTFEQFLEESNWSNVELTYEDFKLI